MSQTIETAKRYLPAILEWLWMATKATGRATWPAILLMGRFSWGFTKWAGRLTLWMLCWPLGLWRSYRHGKRRDQQGLVEALRRAAGPPTR